LIKNDDNDDGDDDIFNSAVIPSELIQGHWLLTRWEYSICWHNKITLFKYELELLNAILDVILVATLLVKLLR
jgi:hypothetical protein